VPPPRGRPSPSLTLRAPPGRGRLLVTRDHGRVLRAGVTAVQRARADRVAERRGYVAASLRDAIRGRFTFLKPALERSSGFRTRTPASSATKTWKRGV